MPSPSASGAAPASRGMAAPLLVIALACAAGLGLRLDVLDAGFWSDDYLHHAMLEGRYPAERAAWDLFRFADGSTEDTRKLVEYGYYPWWAHEHFRLSMLRPLASLLHAADYGTFGLDARSHHLHSLFWWVACLAAVAALFFSLLPRRAAACALVLFALDESHTVPLLWLSNRSVLIASAFAFTGLWAHVQGRLHGRSWGVPLGAVCFALALCAGEYAFAVFGYLLAFELLGAPAGGRLRALAPAVVLAVSFVVVSALGGYGSAHSGLYTSPIADPIGYAAKLGPGLPVLLSDLLWGFSADWWTFGPPLPVPAWRAVQLASGLGAFVALLALWRLCRRWLAPEHAAALRWLLGGALLSLLPVLGSFITSRLVLPASVAVAALLGSLAVAAVSRLRTGGVAARTGSVLLLAAVVSVHVVLAPLVGRDTARRYAYVAKSRTAWPMAAELDDALVAGQRVVQLSAADANDAAYLPFVRGAYGRPMPRSFHLLSGAPGAHRLTRVDRRTLELAVLDDAALLASVNGSLTRSPSEPLGEGRAVDLPGLRVEVLETRLGQPARMRYRFDEPLDSPSLVFLHSTPIGLRRVVLPPPGASVDLPAPQMPDMARLAGAAGL